jgi:hypothetical protein
MTCITRQPTVTQRAVPSREVAVLRAAVAEATELGRMGKAAAGYVRLQEGFLRATRLHLLGQPWAVRLAERWQIALDQHSHRFHVGQH